MNILIERKKTITFKDEEAVLLEKIMNYARHRTESGHKDSGLYACTTPEERETIRVWKNELNSFR